MAVMGLVYCNKSLPLTDWKKYHKKSGNYLIFMKYCVHSLMNEFL